MPACTQVVRKINYAWAKRRRFASSDTGGGAASDAAKIQELQAQVKELERTFNTMPEACGAQP